MNELTGVTFIGHTGWGEHQVYLFDGLNDKWYVLDNIGIWREVNTPELSGHDLLPY